MNKEQETVVQDMELTIEGLGQTMKVIGGALYIGNEYSNENKSTEVFLEDVSGVAYSSMIEKINELHKVVSEGVLEVRAIALNNKLLH